MTIDEIFEVFYSVVKNGSGKEIVDMFNEELNKARGDENKLRFLYLALRKYRVNKMEFEHRDIFKHLEQIVFEEIKLVKGLQE